ncbi:MAG: hypothetical protein N2595_00865 [bacterium]|nr:hypothetical protein [bacterium]
MSSCLTRVVLARWWVGIAVVVPEHGLPGVGRVAALAVAVVCACADAGKQTIDRELIFCVGERIAKKT